MLPSIDLYLIDSNEFFTYQYWMQVESHNTSKETNKAKSLRERASAHWAEC